MKNHFRTVDIMWPLDVVPFVAAADVGAVK